MKKKRSTVYVRPGKDVTLYVPTDTPDEVIQYLNDLKREGMFSQGVMDILTSYVQGQKASEALGSPVHSDTEEAFAATVDEVDTHDVRAENGSPVVLNAASATTARDPEPELALEPEPQAEPTLTSEPDAAQEKPVPEPEPPKKFDLAQIFRRAQYNSGKLTDSPD